MMKHSKIETDRVTAKQLVDEICDLQTDLGHMPYNAQIEPNDHFHDLSDEVDLSGQELTREVHQRLGVLKEKLRNALALAESF